MNVSKDEDGRTEWDAGMILRRWGARYSRTHPVRSGQRRVITDLAACRTAALGGHLEKCDCCGYEHPVYNSCGLSACTHRQATGTARPARADWRASG